MVRVQAGDTGVPGIVVDKAGYVATGAAALGGSGSVSVELKPGQGYPGNVVCVDNSRDIAIIRLSEGFPELKPALPGDSDIVHQWDEVTVVGLMPGEAKTTTEKGAVTGLPVTEDIKYLQTNAALDPGAAGSAVLNKAGELVGMVAWNGGQAGRDGYAIPYNQLRAVLSEAQLAEAAPLAIPPLEPPAVYSDHAAVVWKTNRPATTQVEYGLQASYGNKTAPDYTLLESHSVVMQGLVPKTTYHFRVRSVDCCGREVFSPDLTFTTPAASTAGKFMISNAEIYDIASTAATVRWLTNKPAGSVVSYSADKSGLNEAENDSTLVYDHKVRLNGLRPDTRYSVSIKSVTGNDEVAQQALNSFNTPPSSPVCCKVNCRVPDFTFKTLQGGEFTNRDIAGKKVFVVFTKTSCPTCMKQAIFLNDVYVNWPKGTDMLMFMVASSEKKADVEEWIKKYGLTMPVYIDPTANLVSGCQFRTIPTALFLDTGSVIRDYKSGGFGSKKDMELSVMRFYETER